MSFPNGGPSNPQQPLETDDDLKADPDRAFAALKADGQRAISPSDLRQCAAAPRWKNRGVAKRSSPYKSGFLPAPALTTRSP
jgi:hypothetical protein